MRKLAISTSFRARLLDTGHEVLNSTLELGLRAMELSYNLEAKMARELLSACKNAQVEVVSLHHPCPLPPGVSRDQATGEPHNPASLDPDEQKLAVEDLRRTLDFAVKAGANKVVFHAGGIDGFVQHEEDMNKRRRAGDPSWIEIRDELLQHRQRVISKHLDSLMRTLDSVVVLYADAGVILGLETRFYFMNIPNIQEFHQLFSRFPELAYWHDIGHVWNRAKLGLEGEFDSLKEFEHKLVGYHIHDASDETGDHNAPGTGEIDLEKHLEPGLKRPGTGFVLEPGRKVPDDQMKKGVQLVQSILNKQPGGF